MHNVVEWGADWRNRETKFRMGGIWADMRRIAADGFYGWQSGVGLIGFGQGPLGAGV